MVDNETLRGLLGMGFFIGGAGLLLVFFQPVGSAEQVVSLCSAVMGGALVLGAVMARRFSQRL